MKKAYFLLNIAITSSTISLFAQPGTLDTEFDGDGIVTTGFETYSDNASSMTIQPDGKIIVAGSSYRGIGIGYDFALLRYNTDGSLDNSFGTDGKVLTDINGISESATAVAIQPGGKIVMAGYSWNPGYQNDFALARYNPDGTLDNTFDSDGKLLLDFKLTSDFVFAIAILPNGKIVLAGTIRSGTSNDSIGVMILNEDGTPDNSFGSTGKIMASFGTESSWVSDLIIQTDGKIVVAGTAGNSTIRDFAMARFNTDGSPDNTFSSDGVLTIEIGTSYDYANSLVIQPDGKLVVAGYALAPDNLSSDFALVRYTPDGEPDNTFGLGGKQVTEVSPGFGWAASPVLSAEGKIIVAGSTDDDENPNSNFALVRYLPDGTPDNSFGNDGIVTTEISPYPDFANAVSLQNDGKIVVAGSSSNGTDYDFTVVRYISDIEHVGVIDFSISEESVLIYPNPILGEANLGYTLSQNEEVSICLIDMQGRILQIYLDREKQEAGTHEQPIILPEGLLSGNYLLTISSPRGWISIKIMK